LANRRLCSVVYIRTLREVLRRGGENGGSSGSTGRAGVVDGSGGGPALEDWGEDALSAGTRRRGASAHTPEPQAAALAGRRHRALAEGPSRRGRMNLLQSTMNALDPGAILRAQDMT